jgi:hypothetical protein
MAEVHLQRHRVLPIWNYTIAPDRVDETDKRKT